MYCHPQRGCETGGWQSSDPGASRRASPVAQGEGPDLFGFHQPSSVSDVVSDPGEPNKSSPNLAMRPRSTARRTAVEVALVGFCQVSGSLPVSLRAWRICLRLSGRVAAFTTSATAWGERNRTGRSPLAARWPSSRLATLGVAWGEASPAGLRRASTESMAARTLVISASTTARRSARPTRCSSSPLYFSVHTPRSARARRFSSF